MWWGGIVHPPLAAAALLVALDGWLPSNAERCSLGDNAKRCSLGGAWQIHVFSGVFATQTFTHVSLEIQIFIQFFATPSFPSCLHFGSVVPASRQCSAGCTFINGWFCLFLVSAILLACPPAISTILPLLLRLSLLLCWWSLDDHPDSLQ